MDERTRNSRFKFFMIGAVLMLAFGNGFTLKTIQEEAHNRCVETAKRAAATAPSLRQLVEAHRLDGDPHATEVWQQFLDAAQRNPIPKC